MSNRRPRSVDRVGLDEATARSLGEEKAAKIRVFRLLHHMGQQLHFLADQLYRDDGLTSQQAMLLNVIEVTGAPSLGQAAAVFATSHQNVKQIALALERKGFLEMRADPDDRRVSRLVSTPKSKRFFAARQVDDFAAVARWLAPLSRHDARALQRLLEKLHAGLVTTVAEARGGAGVKATRPPPASSRSAPRTDPSAPSRRRPRRRAAATRA